MDFNFLANIDDNFNIGIRTVFEGTIQVNLDNRHRIRVCQFALNMLIDRMDTETCRRGRFQGCRYKLCALRKQIQHERGLQRESV